MIVDQIKEMKGAIITVVSLVAFGFFLFPQVEKIAKPLRDIASTLESLEHSVDSLGKWTEMRFIGVDIEMVKTNEKVQANKDMIIFVHRND